MSPRVLIVIAALVAALPLSAQQSARPDPAKPAAPAAPSPVGKWAMSIDGPQGSRLDLKLDGRKLTGTVASDMGETTLAGEFADGKLSFSITMQSSGGDVKIGFSGAFKDDGSLAGTLDYGQGAVNWIAARMKEK